MVFPGVINEANPGSSTRNTETTSSTSNLVRPHMCAPNDSPAGTVLARHAVQPRARSGRRVRAVRSVA